jgi:hypothetical protein
MNFSIKRILMDFVFIFMLDVAEKDSVNAILNVILNTIQCVGFFLVFVLFY